MASLVSRLVSLAAWSVLVACTGHDASSTARDGTTGADSARAGNAASPGTDGSGSPTTGQHARAGTGDGQAPSGAPSGSSPLAHVFVAPTYTTLYAVSDVHGHLAQLATLLVSAGLISAASTLPSNPVWTGGDATLVITGDMIDKGPASLDVIASAMALQTAAKVAGGRVVVLLGNHEAEFLGTPMSSKFTGQNTIDQELWTQKPAISPIAFASGADPRGAWLRALPIAAKVDGWFFSHAGQNAGQTLTQIDANVTAALASTAGFASDVFVGTDSLLESRDWYASSSPGMSVVDQNLKALGAAHIVFGHDPNAFGVKGLVYAPPSFFGKLFRLDAGLGAGDSNGQLLRVRHDGADEVAEAILPDGKVHPLFRGPH
jgi:hypothetical protein